MFELNPAKRYFIKTPITSFLLVFGIVLFIITCGDHLLHITQNNSWSLSFEHYIKGQKSSLQPSPLNHPRAMLWLARAALVENNPEEAQMLISPLASSGDIEALIILGDSLTAQGLFGQAIKVWFQAGAYNSLLTVASEAIGSNRFEDGLLALEKAYSINPEKAASPIVTFLLDSNNDPQKALIILSDVIQQYPNSINQAEWAYLIGRVYAKEKQYDKAEIWFARAIALNPNSRWYWIMQANMARENGKINHALDIYSQALTQFPEYAPIYYEMAWAYHLAGSTKEAVQSIEKAIQFMNPPNAWYQVRAGQLYVDDHQLDNALKAFQSAQSIDPEIGTTYLISFLKSTLKDPDQAIAVLQQAIANYPTAPQRINWMLQLAGIFRDNQMWDDAEAIYKEILAEEPANVEAHIGLGWFFYSRIDGFIPAQVEFQKAIEGSPENGQGYLAMGQVLVKEKRYAEADPWFSKAIELAPDNSWWWIERGNALRSAGELTQAIQIYSEAIARFPNFATGYYELAWGYRLNNDRDKSIQAIESALSMISTPSEWYFVRAGQIYEWAESKDRAVAAYQEAIKINPSNSNALEGLNRVNQ